MNETAMFVPLRKEWFEQVRSGTKTIEWRSFGGRFTTERAPVGRRVVFCLGYSGERLHGTIQFSRRVEWKDAPRDVQDIYPRVVDLCAIHFVLDCYFVAERDVMPRN